MVGVFGAFAIAGVPKREGTNGSTLLDFFPSDSVVVIIIQVKIFEFYLFCIIFNSVYYSCNLL